MDKKAFRGVPASISPCHGEGGGSTSLGTAKKLYYVSLRTQSFGVFVRAESAQEACESQGWLVGYCYVREIR